MNFVDAVKTCFTKYVDFSGRARRSEYWFFCLFNFICSLVFEGIAKATGINAITWICTLGLLLPGLAVAVRRLHDIGKSGFYYFMILIPIAGPIILLVKFCQDSDPGDNLYGPNPKDEY